MLPTGRAIVTAMWGRAARLVCAAAIVCASGAARAQNMDVDSQDCSLLDDPSRSPSVWRNLHWSVGSTSRSGQRLAAASLGWNVWSNEVLCRREVVFDSELVYARTALAARFDVEYDVDDASRSSYRPAIAYSNGVTNWGWMGFSVSAGPKLDHRGVAAGATVSIMYIGIDMGLRFDQGIDYDERAMSVYIGLTDLHLHLKSLFSDYR